MYYLKIKNERNGGMRIIFNSEDKNAIYDFITRHGKPGQNYYITDSGFDIIEVLQKNNGGVENVLRNKRKRMWL